MYTHPYLSSYYIVGCPVCASVFASVCVNVSVCTRSVSLFLSIVLPLFRSLPPAPLLACCRHGVKHWLGRAVISPYAASGDYMYQHAHAFPSGPLAAPHYTIHVNRDRPRLLLDLQHNLLQQQRANAWSKADLSERHACVCACVSASSLGWTPPRLGIT